MIIDCHCHAGIGDGLTGPWNTAAKLDKYVDHATRAGITHTVLFSCFHSDYRVANRLVAQIVRSQANRFWGFAFINCRRDRGRIERLVREAVCAFGFCGIKVHRADARITREVCDVAARYQLPILYDPMGEVSVVEMIATEYPKINFIIPHLSSFPDDWRAQHAFIGILTRRPNIYTDTSGVRWFDLIEEAVARAGLSKVLFGSDGPYLNPAVELAKIHAMRLPENAFRAVTSQNWLRLTHAARTRFTAIQRQPLSISRFTPPPGCSTPLVRPTLARLGDWPPRAAAGLDRKRVTVALRDADFRCRAQ
jgi:predicted TIM-barrel fold metal-dependent hydrolase